jgi:hypothetical protein
MPSPLFVSACKHGDVETITTILNKIKHTTNTQCQNNADCIGLCKNPTCFTSYMDSGIATAAEANNFSSIHCLMYLAERYKSSPHYFHKMLQHFVIFAITTNNVLLMSYMLGLRAKEHMCSTCYFERQMWSRVSKSGDLNCFYMMGAFLQKDWSEILSGACQGGNVGLVQLALQINDDDLDYNNALQWAVNKGHRKVINVMLACDYTYNWNYGLWGACEAGSREWVDYFVSKGADDWNEALSRACTVSLELSALMISYGATTFDSALMDMDMDMETPMFYYDLLSLLITSGASDLHVLRCQSIVNLLDRKLKPSDFRHTNMYDYTLLAAKNRKYYQRYLCRCLISYLPLAMLQCVVCEYVGFSVL